MRRLVFPLGFLALLAGLGAPPAAAWAAPQAAECAATAAGANTRLAMIRKLLDSGHPHAALAHLESARLDGPAVEHLQADILRRIGRTNEARTLYQGLLKTCLAGAGEHGLGLLAGQEGQLAASLEHLRRARQALPADARVRNDLGYALLLAGDLEGAQHEFLTAQDLDPEDRKAAMNLVLLFYRQGDAARAEAAGRRYQAGDDELARLREVAQRLAADGGRR